MKYIVYCELMYSGSEMKEDMSRMLCRVKCEINYGQAEDAY